MAIGSSEADYPSCKTKTLRRSNPLISFFFFLLGHACCDFFAFPDFPDFTGCEVRSCPTEAHQSPREVSPKMEEKEKQEQ